MFVPRRHQFRFFRRRISNRIFCLSCRRPFLISHFRIDRRSTSISSQEKNQTSFFIPLDCTLIMVRVLYPFSVGLTCGKRRVLEWRGVLAISESPAGGGLPNGFLRRLLGLGIARFSHIMFSFHFPDAHYTIMTSRPIWSWRSPRSRCGVKKRYVIDPSRERYHLRQNPSIVILLGH
jgi:hypothetical protein